MTMFFTNLLDFTFRQFEVLNREYCMTLRVHFL